jgi:hypothetical protein
MPIASVSTVDSEKTGDRSNRLAVCPNWLITGSP